ncbi:hypothetical protein BKK51_11515 [Rodentibacter trehalosifermentans]|uniref:SAP domain-containing protein n=1 Tax=Rodentibacter trehalosifermentans TaxID=1908263 RepID=A0A1V3IMW4_9PAST|nr:sce7726 family protein [Rodentibacter trehalosifermentans]OOF43461.1 hypothetical protein BKK51_11515 [Rodentibacter trehalosifermentans]
MNEIFIREKLQQKLAREHKGTHTEFLSELPVANFSRRIDLVMANGKLSGFEIKSEQDSLRRLAGQLETYAQYFETVTVVCATKHLNNVMKMVPLRIGIWEFDGENLIERQAPIYQPLSKLNWLSFLNVAGLRSLLKAYKLKVTGLKDELIERALSLNDEQVRNFLLIYLKQRFSQIQTDRREKKLKQQSKPIETLEMVLKESDINLNEEGFITLPSGLKVRPILRR